MDLKTCRFCGMSNYDHKHPAAKSVWIKYGPRHSAHLACGVKAKGEAFIRALPTHRLGALPFFEIQALGLEAALRDELAKRAAIQAGHAASLALARREEKPRP